MNSTNLPTSSRTIIATIKANEFERFYSTNLHKTVFVFSNGNDAFELWKNLRREHPINFLIDYTKLADEQTGIRLTRLIRNWEKSEQANLTSIFLLVDQLELTNRALMEKLGANGTLHKSPTGVSSLLSGTPSESSQLTPAETRTKITPKFQLQIEKINAVLRQFIGVASNKVSSDAFSQMIEGKMECSPKAYINHLASSIPSDEMRQGFLESLRGT